MFVTMKPTPAKPAFDGGRPFCRRLRRCLSPSPQGEHPERREHQTRPTSADDWPETGAKELPMPSLKISYSYRADGQPVLRI